MFWHFLFYINIFWNYKIIVLIIYFAYIISNIYNIVYHLHYKTLVNNYDLSSKLINEYKFEPKIKAIVNDYGFKFKFKKCTHQLRF